MDRKTKRTIALLILVSAVIYGLQLLIFRDPRNTAFYIFQDMAFLPFTIAIATIVVGEIMNAREKKDRIEKTRMLTSSFFTELGAALMRELIHAAKGGEEIRKHLTDISSSDQKALEKIQNQIRDTDFSVHLSEAVYSDAMKMILEHQTMLLVISSNPLLLEHESFTDMLWGIFHLIDEYRLRGDWENLEQADLVHLENDFATVLKLILVNWTSNVQYMKQTYPNFFGTARSRLEQEGL